MLLLNAKIFVIAVFVVEKIQTELSPDGKNVCLQKETYEDKIKVITRVKKINNTKKWCWNISKRFSCKHLTVQWVDVPEFRPINRTRIVPKCCEGYFEEGNVVTKCSPLCLKGCGNGRCAAPELCVCQSGFHGSKCDQACSDGFWGVNCIHMCECSNNGKCDKSSGACDCEPGWTGDKCEIPCQDGYYGYNCKIKCDCENFSCNQQTGECFTTTELNTTETSPEPRESIEISSENEETREEYATEGNIGFTENSVPEEILTVIAVIDMPTSSILIAAGKEIFSNLTKSGVNLEETELTSDTTLTTEVFIDEMNTSREKEKLIHVEKSERGFGDGLKTYKNFTEDDQTQIANNVDEMFNGFINSSINDKTRLNFSGSERDRDNFINEKTRSSHKPVLLYFLPGLFVVSSIFCLTFIIAAVCLINKYKDKVRKKLPLTEKKEKIFQLEEKIKWPKENFFLSNSCANNPVCLADVDLNCTTPVLKTFKPLLSVEVHMNKKIIINDSLKTSL